jgi:hypothetical protein
VDSAGTIYWTNHCSGQLLKLLSGASYPNAVLSGLNGPEGVGADAAGNLYFDEYFKGTLSLLKPNSNTPQVLLSGLDHPNFMSVDANGNVYLITGQMCGDKIVRYDATSHSLTTLLVAPQPHDLSHGFGGLFVTQSGDLYYTTCDYFSVNLLSSGASTPSVILNTTSRPTGIAADTTGDIFYALYNSSVNELPSRSTIPIILTSQGSSRSQLTIDEVGNLYYTDDIGGRIWMIPFGSSKQAPTTSTTTITSTINVTSIQPSTVISVSFGTRTVSVTASQAASATTLISISVSIQTISVIPPTITQTSVSLNNQTTTETFARSEQPTTATVIESVNQTLTEKTTVTQYVNSAPFSSAAIVALLVASSALTSYIVWSSKRRAKPSVLQPTPQPQVDQVARETIDAIVLKYVNDHGGEFSISLACSNLGIPEPQLQESLARLVEKGSLSK